MLVFYTQRATEESVWTQAGWFADAGQTVMDKRLEFVCCFSHDSLIHLLSDHLCPKGKPILSSCPFTVQREHTDISAAERHKAQPIVTNFNLSLSADVATWGLSAFISFPREYCHPVDDCFIYHLLPPVSPHCEQCNSLLLSVSRLCTFEQQLWSFSVPEDLLQANFWL